MSGINFGRQRCFTQMDGAELYNNSRAQIPATSQNHLEEVDLPGSHTPPSNPNPGIKKRYYYYYFVQPHVNASLHTAVPTVSCLCDTSQLMRVLARILVLRLVEPARGIKLLADSRGGRYRGCGSVVLRLRAVLVVSGDNMHALHRGPRVLAPTSDRG